MGAWRHVGASVLPSASLTITLTCWLAPSPPLSKSTLAKLSINSDISSVAQIAVHQHRRGKKSAQVKAMRNFMETHWFISFQSFGSARRFSTRYVPYLDCVEGVPRDDGADAAESPGQEVLHLARPLLLRHRGRFD